MAKTWDDSAVKWLIDKLKNAAAVATGKTDGLLSAADKAKLDGIAAGANKYVHPSYTAKSSGLYKVTVDGSGHVSSAAPVTKSDITALGIPGQDTNTTYGLATANSAGLMSASDKAKVDGFSTSGDYAKKSEVATKPLIYQNVTVPASAWKTGASAAGSTRTKYADIALNGVTSDTYVTVTFHPQNIDDLNLAGICSTREGFVRIYAETAPTYTITIPTIIVGGDSDNNVEKPTIIMSATPHNYLDNSDFANPVNQRSFASGDVSWKYIIDRWMANGTGFSVVSDGVSVPPGGEFAQRLTKGTISNIPEMTAAVWIVNGSAVILKNGATVSGLKLNLSNDNSNFDVLKITNVSSNAIVLKWAALYTGVYTSATLPPYQPKGYAAELSECLRYFYRAKRLSSGGGVFVPGYLSSGAKYYHFYFPLPCIMRTAPSMLFKSGIGNIRINGSYSKWTGNGYITDGLNVSLYSVSGIIADILAIVDTAYDTNNVSFTAQILNTSSQYIDFIADL